MKNLKHYFNQFQNRCVAILTRSPWNKKQLIQQLCKACQHKIISHETLNMLEGVLDISSMQVRDIMIPAAQMVTIPYQDQPQAFLPIMIQSGHSRFPVMHADNKIAGLLLAKDLLPYLIEQPKKHFDIEAFLRPVPFVPKSKRLKQLLAEFQSNRNHLAIVVDEYSHASGLITIEDILELIVGKISDEYDVEQNTTYIQKLSQHTYSVNALTDIDTFNQHFNTHFSNKQFDTIGGLVAQQFGYLPRRYEYITIDGLQFKVMKRERRRIVLLSVQIQPKTTDACTS